MIYALSTSQLAEHPVLWQAVSGLRQNIGAEAAKGQGDTAGADTSAAAARDDAVHLLCMRNGRLAGFLLLLPAAGPDMPAMAASKGGALLRPDEAIWKVAGQGVAPVFRDGRRGMSRIGLELTAGGLEWGLEKAVTGFIIEMETIWILRSMQLGFEAQPLGPPRLLERRRLAPTFLRFDATTLETVRSRRNHHAPVLSRQLPSAFVYMQAS